MVIENYTEHFVDDATVKTRTNHYITVFILRHLQSEAIFRTDGRLDNELTKAGMMRNDMQGEFYRVFLNKRKEIAPERREGRALLRRHGLLGPDNQCFINEEMCGKCPDCHLYGAVRAQSGNNFAYKSKVITDESFSLLPYSEVTTEHTFNALYENGTMRKASENDDGEGEQSRSINSDEVVKTGTFFLSTETIIDVKSEDLIYILSNIMRNKRYGAMTTRLGQTNNHIIGIAFSDCELISSIEWTKTTYDSLCEGLEIPEGDVPEFPLDIADVKQYATATLDELLSGVGCNYTLLTDQDLQDLLTDVENVFSDEETLQDFLSRLAEVYK